jgi:hypothetical protein
MTEFKKVSAAVDEICTAIVDLLRQHTGDIVDVHGKIEFLSLLFADVQPRLRKLLSKAREIDPNRQIYNESMCARIEELCRRFVDAATLLGVPGSTEWLVGTPELRIGEAPTIAAVEREWEEHLLAQAQTDAWKQSIVRNAQELVFRETEERALASVRQRKAREEVEAAFVEERRQIRSALHRREEEKWARELARRQEERSEPREASLLHDDAVRTSVLHRLIDLLLEVSCNPDNQNVRQIRCSNELWMSHFGHPCASLPTGCCCAEVSRYVESELLSVGYAVRYTGTPVALPFKAKSDFRMPCGGLGGKHEYTPMGFEDYGERCLVLEEPEATLNPDGWCEWKSRLDDGVNRLRAILQRHSSC